VNNSKPILARINVNFVWGW